MSRRTWGSGLSVSEFCEAVWLITVDVAGYSVTDRSVTIKMPTQLATDTQNPPLSMPAMILTGRPVAHESGRVSGKKLTTEVSVFVSF